ncbi:ubiquinol oxidase subunit II [Pseudochrobactrum sp. MP213Fo]|uniref:ubiquinol oxidase subunit II n=1 Tax=Pseudochrobactrum sp. MP213Fo TaxID=3022250 RepID=UPI003B9F1104
MKHGLFRSASIGAVLMLTTILAGCQQVILSPSGAIGVQERDLIIFATVIMSLIVIPVIIVTLYFANKYRSTNNNEYTPDWHHSNKIEAVVWIIPCIVVAVLGYVTWIKTHELDPYKALDHAAKPVEVEVVAMNWKWLFIYPEQGIASVNELVVPIDRPLNFRITSGHMMNSFFIPALGGQVYAMPGMQSKLHLIGNKIGTYAGISANYSGAGFSQMRFQTHVKNEADFEAWVAEVRTSDKALNRAGYLELDKPTEKHPVTHYASTEAGLFSAIIGRCVDGKTPCVSHGGGSVQKLSPFITSSVNKTSPAEPKPN